MSPFKIEWCDETVNPQGWGCWGPGGMPVEPKPCWYCYARRMSEGPYVPDCELCHQFVPHWHPEAFDKVYRWKKPRKIFWQSMGDLFHPCTPAWQIEVVLTAVKVLPQHTHIFCTKNPARYAEFNPWPENCVLLTTITGLGDERGRIEDLLRAEARVRGVSIEPLLGAVDVSLYLRPIPNCRFINSDDGTCNNANNPTPECHIHAYCPESVDYRGLNLLIIGAMSGKGACRFIPSPIKVLHLIDQARAAGVPVFVKGELFKQFPIQEWPE